MADEDLEPLTTPKVEEEATPAVQPEVTAEVKPEVAPALKADTSSDWFDKFVKDSTLDPKTIGYVPTPLTEQAPDPTGSVYMAHSRQNNVITNMLDRATTYTLDDDTRKQYTLEDVITEVPKDLLALGMEDRYIGLSPGEEVEAMTAKIRKEHEDKALLAAHPWQSFALSVVDPLDPLTWLFHANILKEIKTGSRIGNAMITSGLSTAGLIGAQEAVLQTNQVTRELDESLFNVAATVIMGSVLGGIGTAIAPVRKLPGRGELDLLLGGVGEGEGLNVRQRLASLSEWKIRKRAEKEVVDVLTEKEKVLTDDGILTPEDMANMRPSVQKSMRLTAMHRLITSESQTAKTFGASAYEHNFTQMKHLSGDTGGMSIESSINLEKGKVSSAQMEFQDIYFKMHGVAKGPFKPSQAKFFGEGALNWDQFNDAVSLTLMTQRPHASEHVNRGAKLLRDRVFEPLKDRAVELGMLPEGVSVTNAMDYFMIVYKKDRIIEQGGRSARGPGTFPQYIFDQFKIGEEVATRYRKSSSYLKHTSDIKRSKEQIAIHKKQKSLIPPKEKVKLKPIDKKIKELKASIKESEKLILEQAPNAAKNWHGELNRTSASDEARWISAEQSVDNITGNTDGVLLNPILERISDSSKPLKVRKLLIDQEGAREWHVTGASEVANMYSRAMIPATELNRAAKEAGFKNVPEWKLDLGKRIKEEYDLKLEGVTGKKAQDIIKKRQRDIKDIDATFDLLMGVYGSGPNVLDNSASKYYHAVLAWNYTRLLGYMTLSSIPDVGLLVSQHGMYRTIHGTLGSFGSIARDMTKTDLRGMGFAMETLLGSRLKAMTDHTGLSTSPNPLSKGFDAMTQNFGNLSLMNPWNDQMHLAAGIVGINRSLEMIHAIVAGEKVGQKEITRLAKLGIDKKHFQTIAKYTEGNVDPKTGARYANWAEWNVTKPHEIEALRQFQAHIGKEINNTIISPGLGDKPLFAHTQVGKFMFQFKTFAFATTSRTLLPNIQRKAESEVYQGYATMLALGGLTYIINSYTRGESPNLSFSNLSRESFDRSGMAGIFGDVVSTTAKVLDIPGVSRYKTRDKLGALLGPTAGAFVEVAEVLNKVGDAARGKSDYTTKDAEKLMRLVPYQNMFYWHQPVKAAGRGVAIGLGAKPVD